VRGVKGRQAADIKLVPLTAKSLLSADEPATEKEPQQRRKEQQMEGTVEKWIDTRGFGFIRPDGGARDVFVHHGAIKRSGPRQLSEGERVSFDVESGERGPVAVNVDPLV